MAKFYANGPLGALLILPNVEAELHGVSAKRFLSGKYSMNDVGYGKTRLNIYYINGKRSTSAKALNILKKHILENEKVEIEGSLKF